MRRGGATDSDEGDVDESTCESNPNDAVSKARYGKVAVEDMEREPALTPKL
jgi:hypothetical protein